MADKTFVGVNIADQYVFFILADSCISKLSVLTSVLIGVFTEDKGGLGIPHFFHSGNLDGLINYVLLCDG